MKESRATYLYRGIRGTCPGCTGDNLFRTRFRLHDKCPDCGLPLEHEDGWSLGAVPLNYSITCIFWVLPIAALHLVGSVNLIPALILAGVGTLIIPIITYKFSKSLWVGIYYAVLPHEVEQAKKEPRNSGALK
ncbi:MAG: DUF983 domain-containing protein [Puniceicoccaceae bacterium]